MKNTDLEKAIETAAKKMAANFENNLQNGGGMFKITKKEEIKKPDNKTPPNG